MCAWRKNHALHDSIGPDDLCAGSFVGRRECRVREDLHRPTTVKEIAQHDHSWRRECGFQLQVAGLFRKHATRLGRRRLGQMLSRLQVYWHIARYDSHLTKIAGDSGRKQDRTIPISEPCGIGCWFQRITLDLVHDPCPRERLSDFARRER